MSAGLPERSIVIIEDSDEDFEVTVWALRQAGVANPVLRCATAAEIAGLLTDRTRWPRALVAAYPLLVLLDLNIPGTDWQETLDSFRSHPCWRMVPIVVISTSRQPATVSTCYVLEVSGYLVKPLNMEAFAAAIRRLAAYWFETVVLPEVPRPGLLE